MDIMLKTEVRCYTSTKFGIQTTLRCSKTSKINYFSFRFLCLHYSKICNIWYWEYLAVSNLQIDKEPHYVSLLH
jgi:hypothetical protein